MKNKDVSNDFMFFANIDQFCELLKMFIYDRNKSGYITNKFLRYRMNRKIDTFLRNIDKYLSVCTNSHVFNEFMIQFYNFYKKINVSDIMPEYELLKYDVIEHCSCIKVKSLGEILVYDAVNIVISDNDNLSLKTDYVIHKEYMEIEENRPDNKQINASYDMLEEEYYERQTKIKKAINKFLRFYIRKEIFFNN